MGLSFFPIFVAISENARLAPSGVAIGCEGCAVHMGPRHLEAPTAWAVIFLRL